MVVRFAKLSKSSFMINLINLTTNPTLLSSKNLKCQVNLSIQLSILSSRPKLTVLDPDLYLELHILPVKKIFVHTFDILLCKCIYGMLPELFPDTFTPISDIHNYETQQAIKRTCWSPSKQLLRCQQFTTYIGPHVWNFILSKINPICSTGSFKRHSSATVKSLI